MTEKETIENTLEGKCSKDNPLFYTLSNLPEFNDLINEQILLEGIKFCEYVGTKYECCKNKVCFENSYCGVRDYRNKWGDII